MIADRIGVVLEEVFLEVPRHRAAELDRPKRKRSALLNIPRARELARRSGSRNSPRVFIGVARIVLQIPGARSLKDRRRVVKGLKDRARSRLAISIAEVGDLERYQVATLGVCVVANEAARCSEVLSHAASLANSADAIVADVATEIVSFGEGGSGVRGGIEQALERLPAPSFTADEDLES